MFLSIPPIQLLAYAVKLVLVACAWRYKRTRYYVASHLALDLVRLGISAIPCGPRPFVGIDFALLLLDGALLLAPSVLLAWAMALDWKAVAGLVAFTMGVVSVTYPNVQGEALARVYVASMAAARLYMVAAPIASTKWRRCALVGDYVLWSLAAAGLVGALVVLTWPGQWTLVNSGNITAQTLLCLFCMLARDRNNI